MRYRLRTLLIAMAVIPAGFFVLSQVLQVWWVGRTTVSIQFVNETGIPIDHIEAAPLNNRGEADFLVSFPAALGQPRYMPVLLDGRGFAQLSVNCSGRASWLTGHDLSYWRQGAVMVRVRFGDGTQSVFAADIPRQRDVRQFVVQIPRGT